MSERNYAVAFHPVSRWLESESRKRLKRLGGQLAEFLSEMKTAQAAVMLKAPEGAERERLGQLFISNLNAIELTAVLAKFAEENGSIVTPKDWRNDGN